MAMSDYLQSVRDKVGHDFLVLPSAAAVVRDANGLFLLAQHVESGQWVIPGGCVDPGESPADAAVRETWEETGVWVRPIGVVGVYGGRDYEVHYANGDHAGYVMTVFLAEPTAKTAAESTPIETKPDGEEVSEARWVAAGELASLPVAPWARGVLDHVMGGSGSAQFTVPDWTPPTA